MGTFNHEDRGEMVKESENIFRLNGFFDDLKLGEVDSATQVFNQSFPIPVYMETEKFGIIFSAKGGSSYIQNALDECNLTVIGPREPGFMQEFQNSMLIENKNPIVFPAFKEYHKMLTGKS